jgi:hypothetical protein
MAISFIEAKSGSANNGGDVTINFSNAQSGDFVLVVGGFQDTAADAGVSTSGYTEYVELGTVNSTIISYKFITSDTGLTATGSTQASDGAAYVALVFRGVDTSNPIDNNYASATGTSEPNSPSITTVTNGAVVVSGFVLNESTTIAGSVGPSGYQTVDSNYLASSNDSDNVTAGATWKAVSIAGAENPGPWDLAGLSSSNVQAITIALRPFAVTTDGRFSATGTGTFTPRMDYGTLVSGALSATGTGTVGWVGTSLAVTGAVAATGTATASFEGEGGGLGYFTMSGNNGSVSWVGGKEYMSSVREVIESRGAATVTVH